MLVLTTPSTVKETNEQVFPETATLVIKYSCDPYLFTVTAPIGLILHDSPVVEEVMV